MPCVCWKCLFFSSRRRHTRCNCDWSSDVCSSDLYKERRDRGDPHHGPYHSRLPDRIVRRTIRGMLPYKQERGKKAFARIMCYIGTPKEIEGKAMQVPGADY